LHVITGCLLRDDNSPILQVQTQIGDECGCERCCCPPKATTPVLLLLLLLPGWCEGRGVGAQHEAGTCLISDEGVHSMLLFSLQMCSRNAAVGVVCGALLAT
jgi:hypothetical protein